jgi:hypothetical protein
VIEHIAIFKKKKKSQAQYYTSAIPATKEAEIRKVEVQTQPGQKVCETSSQPIKSWTWWCKPVIAAMWGV